MFCLYNINKIMYFPFLPMHFDPYYYQTFPITSLKQQHKQSLEQTFPPTLKLQQQNQDYLHQQNSKNLSVDVDELKKAGYQLKKQIWTQQEDRQLLLLVDKKIKWAQIATKIPGRTIKMCYSRYKRIVKRQNCKHKKELWTKDEDKLLIELVDIHGQNWKELASYFRNRRPKQLRERYINSLMPNISKQAWTLEQDLLIIELHNKLGKRWKTIAQSLKCRSENQVKNRFYGRILPLGKRKNKSKI